MLVCGSGVGACVAANKMPGIRAAVCHDTYSAHQGVEHDDMNVLCLGSRGDRPRAGARSSSARVRSGPSSRDEERHVRRLNKVRAIESAQAKEKEQDRLR